MIEFQDILLARRGSLLRLRLVSPSCFCSAIEKKFPFHIVVHAKDNDNNGSVVRCGWRRRLGTRNLRLKPSFVDMSDSPAKPMVSDVEVDKTHAYVKLKHPIAGSGYRSLLTTGSTAEHVATDVMTHLATQPVSSDMCYELDPLHMT